MASRHPGFDNVRVVEALGRQFPLPAGATQTGTSSTSTITPETTEFLLGTNWVIHPKGLKKFSDELRKSVPDAEVTYELGLGCMRISCPTHDERDIMALSKSIMDRIVCQEVGDAWVQAQSDMISPTKGWGNNGVDDQKKYAKVLAPQLILDCPYQTVWAMPEELAENGISIEELLPGESLLKLRQSAGCCIMIASDDNMVHIGAESAQKASVAERKLNTLAKYYALSSEADIRCGSFVYTEDQQAMGAFTYLENGPRTLLTTFFLDRAKHRLTEQRSAYKKLFEKGVAISVLDNGRQQLSSGPYDIVPAVHENEKSQPYKAFVSASWVYRPKEGSYHKDSGIPVSAAPTAPAPFLAELNKSVTSWVSKLPEPDVMSHVNKEPEPPLLDLGDMNKPITMSSSLTNGLEYDEQQKKQDRPQEQNQTPPQESCHPTITSSGNSWPKNGPELKEPSKSEQQYRTPPQSNHSGDEKSPPRPPNNTPQKQDRQPDTSLSGERSYSRVWIPPHLRGQTPSGGIRTDDDSNNEKPAPAEWFPPRLEGKTLPSQSIRVAINSEDDKSSPTAPPYPRRKTPPNRAVPFTKDSRNGKPLPVASQAPFRRKTPPFQRPIPSYSHGKAPHQQPVPIYSGGRATYQQPAPVYSRRKPPHQQPVPTYSRHKPPHQQPVPIYSYRKPHQPRQQPAPIYARGKAPPYQQSLSPNHSGTMSRAQKVDTDERPPSYFGNRNTPNHTTASAKISNIAPNVAMKDSSMLLSDEAKKEKMKQLEEGIKDLQKRLEELQPTSDTSVNIRDGEALPRLAINESRPVIRRSTMRQKAGSRSVHSDAPTDSDPQLVQAMGKRLTQIMNPLKLFAGEVVLKAEFGRFCLTKINQAHVQLQGKDDQARMMPIQTMKEALDRRHTSPGDVMFTNILTANGADMNYLSFIEDEDGKRMWSPGTRRTIYEIRCRARTKEGESYTFFIEIDGDGFTYRVRPATPEACILFVHCPKRSWDFQVKLSMFQNLGESFGAFAKDLVDSMCVMPQKSGIPVLQFVNNKAYQVDVLLARTINIASYTRGAKGYTSSETTLSNCGKPVSAILEVSEVHDMCPTDLTSTEDKLIITFGRYPGNPKLGQLPVWYEASIQSHMVKTALLQNRDLEFGDEVGWSAEELQKAGAFDAIVQTATDVIKKMDGVGYWGDNNQDALVHGLPPSGTEGPHRW
ncbi:hypothetical protein F4779DRAFT_619945 [Xylariaceae sp. FL0662B]|nr:hypothetical protein F4779DRAFT_619945 [Xylariaceae sp. FL0662B]